MTDPHHDHHETVVVEERGSPIGLLLGVVGIVVLVIAIWYFAFGPGAGTGSVPSGGDSGGGTNTEQSTPAPEGS